MGLRTELAIDGDRCRSCGSWLATEGITLDRYEVIQDGMIITMVAMLCCHCFAVTFLPYFGELLPSEPMQDIGGNWNGYPPQHFTHGGEG